MKKNYLLQRCHLASQPAGGAVDILVMEGYIAEVRESFESTLPVGVEPVECRGLTVFAGPVDNHVHFREPGPTAYKEGWQTGSRAALKGGMTGVVEIQNSEPWCDTPEAINEKARLVAANSLVEWGFYGTVSPGSAAKLPAIARKIFGYKLFMGHSTGKLGVGREEWDGIAKVCAKNDIPLIVHAEDGDILAEAAKSVPASCTDNNRLRPPEAEISAVRDAIALCRRNRCKLHVFHVSTAGAMDLILSAKAEGLPVSSGVCPHHLIFTAGDALNAPSLLKVFPPLREEEDREALIDAFCGGQIDVLQSDHAPHTLEEKSAPFHQSPGGLPGVQQLLPLAVTLASRFGVTMAEVERMLCFAPREILGIAPAKVTAGVKATMTLVDVGAGFTVNPADCASRCGWTPYEGMRLLGVVKHVFVNGRLALGNGKVMEGGLAGPLAKAFTSRGQTVDNL